MKQETLDYIASSIGVTAIVSTYIFWLASRQIKDKLVHRIDLFTYDLTKKQENDQIAIGYKIRRWQDTNRLRSITLECRIDNIERKLDIPSCNIIETIENEFEDTD